MEEKMLYDVAVVTPVAEDTVEAAHQCMSQSFPAASSLIQLLTLLLRGQIRAQNSREFEIKRTCF
jgi:hypothetical protein